LNATDWKGLAMLPVRRALISVYDKRGLDDFARGLAGLDVTLVSTGGTYRHLSDLGLEVTPVSEVTDFPEILDGRVKTLHPKIHGGILADRSRSNHAAELNEHAIPPIDLVAVNLYPFRETAARADQPFEKVVEMIDIGGPTMVRAAAKNFRGVVVVVDPEDYPQVLRAIEENDGHVPEPLRRQLALKAFRHTQSYDAAIAHWLKHQLVETAADGETPAELFPAQLSFDLTRAQLPRYGENPHQQAAVYEVLGGKGVFGGYRQLQGKELSYNNFLDADAARKMVALFDRPAVVVVKHNNPCGVGLGDDHVTAYRRALETDPVSAFGSIVAVNGEVSAELAEAMADLFVEVVIAPSFSDGAREVYGAKANLRLVACPAYDPGPAEVELKAIAGGFLGQVPDAAPEDPTGWTCPTRRQPTPEERQALTLAWKVCRYTKSNAVVLTNRHQAVGVGAGQMSRVDSCRIAIEKAHLPVQGTVAASDAFFPFRDGLDLLAEAGVTAVIQPGGSKRDDEVVAAADEAGIAMLMTGRRHFRH
jgi:phosphoribosylaminoimidazolecarboxamide formyltransferase / IMP cyclohydrolase